MRDRVLNLLKKWEDRRIVKKLKIDTYANVANWAAAESFHVEATTIYKLSEELAKEFNIDRSEYEVSNEKEKTS